ncbi:MAG: glycosyltransferase [Holophagales bacterium]|nr:glycosyltransferase [Holophagales bacterium]
MSVTAGRPLRAVSLVVPMFNEERSLTHFLDVARDALGRHVADWEVVLVDDASTDGTAAAAGARAADEPRIRVVRHERNRGLGGALKSGFPPHRRSGSSTPTATSRGTSTRRAGSSARRS